MNCKSWNIIENILKNNIGTLFITCGLLVFMFYQLSVIYNSMTYFINSKLKHFV